MVDFSYLSGLSKDLFEVERLRILREAIEAAPEHLQPKLWALQILLDEKRKTMSSPEFIAECLKDCNENLNNLSDQFVSAMNVLLSKGLLSRQLT